MKRKIVALLLACMMATAPAVYAEDQDLAQRIEDLEARVSALEALLTPAEGEAQQEGEELLSASGDIFDYTIDRIYEQTYGDSTYIIVDMTLVNKTDQEQEIRQPYFGGYVDDLKTNPTFGVGDLPMLGGKLAAGKTFKGCMGYKVSGDWDVLEIEYGESMNNKITFTVTKNSPGYFYG